MARGSFRTWAAVSAGVLILGSVVWLTGTWTGTGAGARTGTRAATHEPASQPHRGPGLAPPPTEASNRQAADPGSAGTEAGGRMHGTVPLRSTGTAGPFADAPTANGGRGAPGVAGSPSTIPLGGRPLSSWPVVRVDQAVQSPEETAIAVDPTDPSRIVAVAQGAGCYHFRSGDGGATWTEGLITDPFDLGDPTLTMDANGIAYCGYIGTFQHSGIYITRSTDGGATWHPGVAVIEHSTGVPFEDKEYPACDHTNGAYAGSLYIAWTQFDRYSSAATADSTRILFSWSRDQGATFAPPVRVSDRGGNCVDGDNTVEGAVPAVGPDGTVYLAWAGPRGIEFDRSTDGGRTWGADRVISNIPGGWDFPVAGVFRANGLPITKTDTSIGPHSGRVYVAWSDQRNGDTDVFLMFSDDRGAHWSPRVRVNGDAVGNGRDQFFPWIDVDPMTGRVHLVYYDRRATTDTGTEVWLATSTDGGATFTEEVISQSPFTPEPTVFFGDYIGLSAHNGHVRPFWMRLDGRQLSVWTALVDQASTAACDPTGLRLVAAPNPARTETRIFACGAGTAPGRATSPVQVFGVNGRLVRSFPAAPWPETGPVAAWDLRDESGSRVPSGIYLVRTPSGAATRLVVAR
jgi:hypothetical protein